MVTFFYFDKLTVYISSAQNVGSQNGVLASVDPNPKHKLEQNTLALNHRIRTLGCLKHWNIYIL